MKIVELYIDDNDEESGIDRLSLVQSPATHYKWEIFEDETECDGDCQLRHHFSDKGDDLDWLIHNSAGFKVSDLTKEDFYTISSTPTDISPSEDGNGQIVRFYFAVDVGMGPTLIKESRKLCREMIRKDLVYRKEDVVQLSDQVNGDANTYKLVPRPRGTSVSQIVYGNGKYCRHLFKKIVFTIPEGITPDEFVKKVPKRAKRTINSKVFGVRPEIQYQIGIAAQSQYKQDPPKKSNFSEDYEGPIGLLEGLVMYNTIDALFKGEPDAEAICLIEVDGIKGYIGGIPENDNYFNADVKVLNSVKIENFESYDDYPQAASDAACKVLRWRDEHGDEVKGMTRVGWTRANQLCNREPISEETIARMASFARHRQNADISEEYKGTPWKDAGYVAWLGWGDTAGIEWSQRKLKSIRQEMKFRFGCVQRLLNEGYGEDEARIKCYRNQYPDTEGYPDNLLPLSENMSQKSFKDDLNYEVTTVVMEPNRYIVRRDDMTGELYYVFFTKETVKSMLKKFYKQNKHKSFNYEHSGLKLNGGYVYESWLTDPDMDKSKKMGFNVNPGTWMATIKFDNKKMFEEYILSEKTTGISLEGSFLSRPGNLNSIGMTKIGEIDGLPIFDNEEEARKYGLDKYGCVGVHQHRPGEFMPCESHDILMKGINNLYKNNNEVFIDEVRSIINQLNNQNNAK